VRSEREDREISAMERCDHPHIGKFLSIDSIVVDGQSHLFLIEEYLTGGTLSDRLRNGLLSRDEVIELGSQLINAIQHISAQNLIHRDIKPDNIMFRGDGVTPVIVDFGLVRDLSATSLTNTWQLRGPGTPFYAAPEQLNNDKAMQSWRTDQFSLGVVLAFSLFGKHPYDYDGSPQSTVDAVATNNGPSNEFIANVHSVSLPTLAKMVEPYPTRRYRFAETLSAEWSMQKGN
jgi:serine/threonine protein kinase